MVYVKNENKARSLIKAGCDINSFIGQTWFEDIGNIQKDLHEEMDECKSNIGLYLHGKQISYDEYCSWDKKYDTADKQLTRINRLKELYGNMDENVRALIWHLQTMKSSEREAELNRTTLNMKALGFVLRRKNNKNAAKEEIKKEDQKGEKPVQLKMGAARFNPLRHKREKKRIGDEN